MERHKTLAENPSCPFQAKVQTQDQGCGRTADALIFGKRGGKEDVPDGHLLRRLKGLAKDAGLNCGACSTCIEGEECERWFLHKFRATYITTLLRAGMDLRTVMKLSGHSDLASVMRYLRPAEGTEVQNRVNAIQWR
jgi:integrase